MITIKLPVTTSVTIYPYVPAGSTLAFEMYRLCRTRGVVDRILKHAQRLIDGSGRAAKRLQLLLDQRAYRRLREKGGKDLRPLLEILVKAENNIRAKAAAGQNSEGNAAHQQCDVVEVAALIGVSVEAMRFAGEERVEVAQKSGSLGVRQAVAAALAAHAAAKLPMRVRDTHR